MSFAEILFSNVFIEIVAMPACHATAAAHDQSNHVSMLPNHNNKLPPVADIYVQAKLEMIAVI